MKTIKIVKAVLGISNSSNGEAAKVRINVATVNVKSSNMFNVLNLVLTGRVVPPQSHTTLPLRQKDLM